MFNFDSFVHFVSHKHFLNFQWISWFGIKYLDFFFIIRHFHIKLPTIRYRWDDLDLLLVSFLEKTKILDRYSKHFRIYGSRYLYWNFIYCHLWNGISFDFPRETPQNEIKIKNKLLANWPKIDVQIF